MIPRNVGALYVNRQGASFPIGCMLPRIESLSSEQREVGVKQRVELPALNSTESRVAISSLLETMTATMVRTPTASISRCRRDERYRERIYKKSNIKAIGRFY